ncbi:MAG TPA: WecB/TagA/CpsF family glycosyltransferase [Pseudogracilibacillus sp.]|nr:WecB/TagA/CpsF family glycosyltransferase [Pseudogracilibacillus sp.]
MPNTISKTRIMGIPFVDATMNDFMQNIVEPVTIQSDKCFIVTANPEIVMEADKNDHYAAILHKANYIVPDGVGILMAAKWKKQPLASRIAGVELMDEMLQLADKEGYSCFFLGGTKGVNEVAVEKIKIKYPNLQVAGRHHGYFDLDDEEVVAQVRDAAPDFVFAALGFPKQEEWIATHWSHFSKGVFIGVGGSFDIYAEKVKRAPSFWIKLRLEWLYRLLQQPARFKRILPLFAFAWKALLKRNDRN